MRRYTIPLQVIALGHGVGGAAQHYAGAMGRFGPWTYQMYSATASRYGADFLNAIQPNQRLQDWPMTYDEYEPYYVEWEKAWGVAGTNQGPLVPMSQNYPLPPHPQHPGRGRSSRAATEAMGYNPYPPPTALASQAYVNQYGVAGQRVRLRRLVRRACNYACETGAKANSAFRTIPAAIKSGNFTHGPEQLRLQARHRPRHGECHRREVLRRRPGTSTCSRRRPSSTGCGASTSPG